MLRGDFIFEIGGLLFLISSLIVLGADKQYNKGKIKDLKTLLKIKVSGLLVTIIAVILMIYGK